VLAGIAFMPEIKKKTIAGRSITGLTGKET
jgi:hypothetical protein